MPPIRSRPTSKPPVLRGSRSWVAGVLAVALRATLPGALALGGRASGALGVGALGVAGVLGVGALGVGATGCSHDYIPNTDVDDTEENRKVVAFCEKYRHAVERKDIARLLQLAHPEYDEDGGNVDASDDIDFAGLKDYLTSKFDDAQSIRYEIRYRRVTVDDERVFVDYTFSASFRIPSEKGDDVWQRKVSDNRLELVPHQEEFRIVAGM